MLSVLFKLHTRLTQQTHLKLCTLVTLLMSLPACLCLLVKPAARGRRGTEKEREGERRGEGRGGERREEKRGEAKREERRSYLEPRRAHACVRAQYAVLYVL